MSSVAEIVKNSANVPETSQEITDHASIVLRLMFMSVINLLIGTIQGVVQTFPGVAQWIREAGPAGHLIDPLAHAHINLVGGVTLAIMGLFYYVLPKLVHRPLYSSTLASVSFWFSVIGVTSFFSSLVVLGIIEGNMVHRGMTYAQALETVGTIHHVLIMTSAFLMGFGYWAFISNTLLTIFKKPKGEANASSA